MMIDDLFEGVVQILAVATHLVGFNGPNCTLPIPGLIIIITVVLISFLAVLFVLLSRQSTATTTAKNARSTVISAIVYKEATVEEWEGWGTSLAWWAKVFGQREDLADAFFTTSLDCLIRVTSGDVFRVPGLGMTIARYNVGGCSEEPFRGETMSLPQSMQPSQPYWYRVADGYWVNGLNEDPKSSSWDWNRDTNQRSMMLLAAKHGVKFEFFSNSPMWWMCKSKNPAGAYDGLDNLLSESFRQHAVYMATVAAKAQNEWGVKVLSVEPFNEPSSLWWKGKTGTQEGCYASLDTLAKVICFLREELDRRGLQQVIVAGTDENQTDLALKTWDSFDVRTKAAVGRVNTHGYMYTGGRRDLLLQSVKRDGKALWNSEYEDGNTDAVQLTTCLHMDMFYLQPCGWIYWQMLDSAGFGAVTSNPGDLWIGGPNAKYFALAHYTRHIRPGARILKTSEVSVVAAYHPSEKSLTIICLNTNPAEPQEFKVDISAFNFSTSPDPTPVSRWESSLHGKPPLYVNHNDTHITTTPDQKSHYIYTKLSPSTVQTFSVQNVQHSVNGVKYREVN